MKPLIQRLLITVLVFFVCMCKAQNKSIDSLKNLLKTKNKTNDILNIKKEIGTLLVEKGEYVSALQWYLEALKLGETSKDTVLIAGLYNNIAVIYFETERKALCFNYASKAVELFECVNEPGSLGDAYNTLATYYYSEFKDSLALNFFNLSLEQRIKQGDKKKLSSAYSNLGAVYFEIGDTLTGKKLILKSISIRKELKNADLLARAYLQLGEVFMLSEKLDSAKKYLDLARELIDNVKSLHQKKNFYESYAILNSKLKNYQLAYQYQKLLTSTKDSILSAENSKSFVEMQTKYETHKKESQLTLNELELKKQKQKSFYILVVFISVIIVLITIGVFIYYRYKIKQKIKFEAEIQRQEIMRYEAGIKTLEKERNRIANELHDNTGALISFIISKTDFIINNTNNSKEELILVKSSAQEVMTSLRETLWTLNNKSITNHDLIDKLKVYIKKHLLISCKIIDRSQNEFVLSNDAVLALYRCVQEIITNVNKHSKANKVNITFFSSRNVKISIIVEDNGVGFEENEKEESYGLRNLKFRLEEIGATLIIDSASNKGTIIYINYL